MWYKLKLKITCPPRKRKQGAHTARTVLGSARHGESLEQNGPNQKDAQNTRIWTANISCSKTTFFFIFAQALFDFGFRHFFGATDNHQARLGPKTRTHRHTAHNETISHTLCVHCSANLSRFNITDAFTIYINAFRRQSHDSRWLWVTLWRSLFTCRMLFGSGERAPATTTHNEWMDGTRSSRIARIFSLYMRNVRTLTRNAAFRSIYMGTRVRPNQGTTESLLLFWLANRWILEWVCANASHHFGFCVPLPLSLYLSLFLLDLGSDVIQNKNMRRFPAWIFGAFLYFYVQLNIAGTVWAMRFLCWCSAWFLFFYFHVSASDAVFVNRTRRSRRRRDKKSSEIYSALWKKHERMFLLMFYIFLFDYS